MEDLEGDIQEDDQDIDKFEDKKGDEWKAIGENGY